MGSVVLDCWEMSVVRHVRLHGWYHALLSINLLLPFIDFSFRTTHGFILDFYPFFFIYLILLILSLPLVRFRRRTNALGYRRSWRWSSHLLFLFLLGP
jgi:hypothetical protein